VHRDPETSEYLVRDGEAQKPGVEIEYDPFEKTTIDYVGHDGSQKSLPIKTQTRLKLFIPEMRDFVWFLLKTTSYYDSLNIQNNMQAVQAVASAATGGNVSGVRINVFRAQQNILWNSPNGPRRIKKWLVQVKVDPDWVEKMIVRMSTNTLNAGMQVQQLSAPESAPDPEVDHDESDDSIIDGVVTDIEEDPMTIERACAMETSEGVKYYEISDDGLNKMYDVIEKHLNEEVVDADTQKTYLEKQDAIKVILQARSDGSL